MKRLFLAIALLGAAVALPLLAAPITVVLPETMRSATLEVGLYGRGLCIRTLELEISNTVDPSELAGACASSDHDFTPITEARFLLLAPGHQVTSSITALSDRVWQPNPPELPVVTVRGHVASPLGHPLVITFEYLLIEAMRFFGYTDGRVPQLLMARTDTDSDGGFEVTLPDLRHDPFISGRSRLVAIRLNKPNGQSPAEAMEHYRLDLQQLYQGGPLILDQQLAWPSNHSLQRTRP